MTKPAMKLVKQLMELVITASSMVKTTYKSTLKVHKRDNLFGSDFEFFTIFAFNMFKNYNFLRKKFDLAIIEEAQQRERGGCQ
jgi:hypothetical protein